MITKIMVHGALRADEDHLFEPFGVSVVAGALIRCVWARRVVTTATPATNSDSAEDLTGYYRSDLQH
jgi:hypothetical protein